MKPAGSFRSCRWAVLTVLLTWGGVPAANGTDYTALNRASASEMTIQAGHAPGVLDLDFSPDGLYFASVAHDSTVKVWATDGRLVRTLPIIGHGPTGIAFSPCGDRLVVTSTSWYCAVQIWGVDGALIQVQNHLESAIPSFDAGGQFFSHTFDGAGGVEILKNTGEYVADIDGYPDTARFAPDGRHVAVSPNRMPYINLTNFSGEVIRRFDTPDRVGDISFSGDGRFIACCTKQGIHIWDLTGPPTAPVTIAMEVPPWEIQLNRDGTRVVGSRPGRSADGRALKRWTEEETRARTVAVWDREGRMLWERPGYHGRISCLDQVAVVTDDRYFNLYDSDGTLVRTIGALQPDAQVDPGLVERVLGLKLFSYGYDAAVTRFDLLKHTLTVQEGENTLCTITDEEFRNTVDGDCTAAMSPDGTLVAAGFDQQKTSAVLKVWQVPSGELKLAVPRAAIDPECYPQMNRIVFTPDGKYIVCASSDFENRLFLWDLEGRLVLSTRVYHFGGENIYERPDLSIISLAVSPDETLIATGSNDNVVRVWDRAGALIRICTGHKQPVTDIRFAADGRYVLSSSLDIPLRIWDVTTGDAVTLVSGGGEWVMFTDDGLFESTRNGGRLVAMAKGMEVFGIDQLALCNNRPDLILERMGLGTPEQIAHYRARYERRLSKAGVAAGAAGSYHLPDARIDAVRQDGRSADVTFTVTDTRRSLTRWNLYVNDVPQFGAYGREASGTHLTITERIALTRGRNKIEVSCTNDRGLESYRALTFLDLDDAPPGDLYFLGLGVSEYSDAKLNLKYAHKDAGDLAAAFERLAGMYAAVHVQTLLNSQVTVEAIRKAKGFLTDARVDDTFVLFIAGHGVHDSDAAATYYFLTYETDLRDLAHSAAPFELIEDLLQGIAPRNKLFLMDTCESGEVEEDATQRYTAMAGSRGLASRAVRGIGGTVRQSSAVPARPRTYLLDYDRYIYNDLARRSGAIVFSSSRGGEFSYESDAIRNGLFTAMILAALEGSDAREAAALTAQALTGPQAARDTAAGSEGGLPGGTADADGDGTVSTDELRAFVMGAVPVLSCGLQHPTVDRDNLYQKFAFPVIPGSGM